MEVLYYIRERRQDQNLSEHIKWCKVTVVISIKKMAMYWQKPGVTRCIHRYVHETDSVKNKSGLI